MYMYVKNTLTMKCGLCAIVWWESAVFAANRHSDSQRTSYVHTYQNTVCTCVCGWFLLLM